MKSILCSVILVLALAVPAQAQRRGGFIGGTSFNRGFNGSNFNRGFNNSFAFNRGFNGSGFNFNRFPNRTVFVPTFVGTSYLPSYGASYSYPASYGGSYGSSYTANYGGSSGLFTVDTAGNVYDAQTGAFMGRLIR